ncbi:MAG: ABC transporter permease subunit, partial [Verrucomicrobiota bacterium]
MRFNVLPVIERELRSDARRWTNYWLRVLVGTIAVVILVLFHANDDIRNGQGNIVFTCLHSGLFFSIWLWVPGLVADCLAREKREGTLPLLALTPLRPAELVLGKVLGQMLLGLTILLAAIPVLSIPFLLGGVVMSDLITSTLLLLCAFVLSFSSGLLASAQSRSLMRSLILALILNGLLLFAFWLFVNLNLLGKSNTTYFDIWSDDGFFAPLALWTGFSQWGLGRSFGGLGVKGLTPQEWWTLQGAMALFSMAVFVVYFWIAARLTKQSWCEQPMTEKQQRIVRLFTRRILFRAWISSRLRRTLDWNPILWLHQFSWQARLTKWGWAFGFIVIECFLLTSTAGDSISFWDLWEIQPWLIGALGLGLSFAAAAGFHLEKGNGALELVLVSPLTVRQIIWGRVLGLWKQFFPAALIVATACTFILVGLDTDRFGEFEVTAPTLVIAFLTWPVVGTYFSLRFRRIFTAWLMTWVLAGL